MFVTYHPRSKNVQFGNYALPFLTEIRTISLTALMLPEAYPFGWMSSISAVHMFNVVTGNSLDDVIHVVVRIIVWYSN